MRVRVPSQSSTKWWILLAAAIATGMTWWQAGTRRPAPPREPEYIWLDADDIAMPADGALDPLPDAAR